MPEGAGPPKLINYLLTYLDQRVSPAQQGKRNREELRTLANALDALVGVSDPEAEYDEAKARTADSLMQRFKCLEQSILDGDWHVAASMSIVDENELGLTSQAEKEAALNRKMREYKFAEAKRKMAGT